MVIILWGFLQDQDALLRLHYGIVPRKNYFEYFTNTNKDATSASNTVNSSDRVNSGDRVNSMTPSSEVTGKVDTVTVTDSDDCIVIS